MHVLFIVILLLVCVGMPLGCTWRMWRLDESSLAAWLICAAEAALPVALVILVGRWDIAGFCTRFVLIGAFLAAVLLSFMKHARRPWRPTDESLIRSRPVSLVSVTAFAAALAYVASGSFPPDRARDLAFPIQGGRFVVAHGGGTLLLNHHAGHREQRYAADITAVGRWGHRASGVPPEKLDRYVVFGASVVSPCAGEVVSTRGDLPDLVPPERDARHPPGNHVMLDCGDVHVELAHLQRGSITVQVGQRVEARTPIGKVGNSGNTTEPHLHIHALDPDTRLGVPIALDGRPPLRNALYVN